MSIKEQIRAEIERRINYYTHREDCAWDENNDEDALWYQGGRNSLLHILAFLDTLPEQPVRDHHEIEVEFRGEKVTINREFYRDGERNYSTREQDDNAIWAALRAWCEKKGITPFELYPKQSEQPVEGLEEEIDRLWESFSDEMSGPHNLFDMYRRLARYFAEWQKAKMMERAVEGEVVKDINNKLGAVTAKNVNLDKFKFGDKVKILVIKDEGK